jgi:gas vesicle protein
MLTNPNDTTTQNASGPGFTMGLITGGFIGAMLALAFAPRAGADLRRSVADTARTLGTAADRLQDASARASAAVAPLADKVRAAGDDAADRVERGAHDVAEFAASTRS